MEKLSIPKMPYQISRLGWKNANIIKASIILMFGMY